MHSLRLTLAAGALTLANATSAVGDDSARGRAIVEANCAPCHAVGRSGASPHPDAPPFRTLSQRYPIESLAEALAEGISTGHPDMPEFVAAPAEIDAIIAYVRSLGR